MSTQGKGASSDVVWDVLLLLGMVVMGAGWYFVGSWPAVLVYVGALLMAAAVGGARGGGRRSR